jgi:flagellar basal-body rod protein FlgG
MRTTGYKRGRADFQDLLYQNVRQVGSQTSDAGNLVPTGVQIGSGVRIAATPRIMTQGTLESTSKELDVAIKGEGFFQVLLPDGRTAYTRDGSFERDSTGNLVTADGYQVNPTINIPSHASGITISATGVVSAVIGTASTSSTLGTITLARFVNKTGLEGIGNNLYLANDASGAAITGNPGDDSLGNLSQGSLETSNVNAVTEITDLIPAQRAYEMNSRVVTAADEMLQATANMK